MSGQPFRHRGGRPPTHLERSEAVWCLGAWVPGCLGAWVPGCLGAWAPTPFEASGRSLNYSCAKVIHLSPHQMPPVEVSATCPTISKLQFRLQMIQREPAHAFGAAKNLEICVKARVASMCVCVCVFVFVCVCLRVRACIVCVADELQCRFHDTVTHPCQRLPTHHVLEPILVMYHALIAESKLPGRRFFCFQHIGLRALVVEQGQQGVPRLWSLGTNELACLHEFLLGQPKVALRQL